MNRQGKSITGLRDFILQQLTSYLDNELIKHAKKIELHTHYLRCLIALNIFILILLLCYVIK